MNKILANLLGILTYNTYFMNGIRLLEWKLYFIFNLQTILNGNKILLDILSNFNKIVKTDKVFSYMNKMIENNTKSLNDKSSNLISDYNNLKNKIKEYFPKVEENLILDILRIQTKQKDWIGSTTIEIQYIDNIDLKKKKDKLYDRYNMLPIEKDDRTLRFKAKGMYLQNMEELLEMDSEIEFISGEAEVTEKEQYPSTH